MSYYLPSAGGHICYVIKELLLKKHRLSVENATYLQHFVRSAYL
jgi:hypothetical protein